MTRYIDGDVRAFDRLMTVLEPRIRRSLTRWLRSSADIDDAVQTTLLKMHRARHRYRPGAPVLPWVLTIARHVAVDDLRRPARRNRGMDEVEVQRIPDERESPWLKEDENEVIQAVRDAIEDLPASSREVVRLHKLEGRSMAEVASILGLNEGAVRVRAHRGYKALAKRLLGFWEARKE
ncbi:MAG: RNA polymerase sigma factor [Myxococcota bacterium]